MLRVIRFGVRMEQPAFETFAREVGIRRMADGGALAVVAGRSDATDPQRYAIVSRFTGFDAMVRVIGSDLLYAQFLGEWRERLQEAQAEHFEAMELDPANTGTGAPRLLRIYSGRIAEADATEYYEFIRREAWPLIRARPGLVTAMFGRRVEEGEHGIAFITAWSTEPEAGTPEAQAVPLRPSSLVRDEQVELYSVIGSYVRD
ncbi:MAG TPA: hypothetical protein VFK54_04065 [Candidatus Limnocylindrales bacterium]|nr:hypothetical protein [Candidatus Limnocylindrales bacterium]